MIESEVKMETGKLETKEEYKTRRHIQYLKARANGMSWTYHNKPLTDEQKEKKRLYDLEYKKAHAEKNKEYMRKWHKEHYEEEKRSWQEYRRNNKKLAIEYLGGKCVKCDGVFHPDVYDFHHANGDEKDICVAKLLGRKFSGIIKELDKCILLCANCHRIEHAQY